MATSQKTATSALWRRTNRASRTTASPQGCRRRERTYCSYDASALRISPVLATPTRRLELPVRRWLGVRPHEDAQQRPPGDDQDDRDGVEEQRPVGAHFAPQQGR